MYSKIYNPDTNRWVSIKSKKGKSVLENYLNFSKSGGNKKKTGKPKIDSFNGRGSLESWLKVIVYREVIHHQKNRVKIYPLKG